MAFRIAQWTDQHVAVEAGKNHAGQSGRRRPAALTMGDFFAAAPGQQRFEFGWRAVGSGVEVAVLSAGQSDRRGLQARTGDVDPPHKHLLDRDVLHQHGSDVCRRLADLDVPTRLLPHIQEHLLKGSHFASLSEMI